jgi:hypothetical protein
MKRPSVPYCLSDDDAGPDQHRSNLLSDAASLLDQLMARQNDFRRAARRTVILAYLCAPSLLAEEATPLASGPILHGRTLDEPRRQPGSAHGWRYRTVGNLLL